MLSTRLNLLASLAFLMAIVSCAKEPPVQVAHGEDHGLFSKDELRDGPFVAQNLTGRVADLARVPLAEDVYEIDFVIGESILNIFKITPEGERQAYLQFTIRGHWDLVRDTDRSGSQNQYLVKSQRHNPAWQDRAYIEVDTYDVKRIDVERERAERENNLFAVSRLNEATFKLLEDEIPGVDQRRALELAQEHGLAKGDTIIVKLTMGALLLQTKVNGLMITVAELPVRFFDLVQRENAAQEKTHELRVDDTKAAWSERRYVQVMPDKVYISNANSKLLDKNDLQECFDFDHLPIAEIAADLSDLGLKPASGEQVCFDIAQTVLSVNVKGKDRSETVLTYQIQSHVDMLDLGQSGADLSVGTSSHRSWENRRFISVIASRPQPVKNLVGSNVLPRSAFEGEFLYVATIAESHSEIGSYLVPGFRNTSDSRLRFEFSEDKLTAYRVRETLNSSNPAPVLRYGVNHFTVERTRNSFGDPTNIIAEVRDRPWQQLKDVRANWARNEIPGYFNEFFGVERLVFRQYIISESRLIGEVQVDNDGMIWFMTEEVLTPNALAGNLGGGETTLQPKSVIMRHSFMPVGDSAYEPKVYDDYDFRRFGFFRTTELALEDDEGATDRTKRHFINRFDISGKRQIVWTVNKEFPEEYWELTQRAIDEWNKAFEAATGRSDVLVLKPNQGEDHTDPRVNMIAFIPERNVSGILGYGPMVTDPETGEALAAQSFMYESVFKSVMRRVEAIYDFVVEQLPAATESAIAGEGSEPSAVDAHSERGFDFSDGFTIPELSIDLFDTERVVEAVTANRGLRPSNLQRTLERVSNAGTLTADSLVDSLVGQEMFKAAADIAMTQDLNQGSALVANRLDCFIHEDDHFSSAVKYIQFNRDRPKDEVLQEIKLQAIYTTLLHELGHNFGLRHNFHGSFDEMNYAPGYFSLQENPQSESESDFEEMYMSSTVMDYQDVFQDLAGGLGHYDIAAVKYGYGGIMEVLDPEASDEAGHPVSRDLPKSEFQDLVNQVMVANPNASRLAVERHAEQMLNVRPYMFCTDQDVANDPTCNRHDSGRTMAEIVENMIEDYHNNYLLFGFRNGRRQFTGNSTAILTRYLLPIRQVLDEFAYKSITGTFATRGAGSQQDFINALSLGFEFFLDILATVDPGPYYFDGEDEQWKQGTKEGAKSINVPLGVGKHLEPSYERVGLEERVMRRGTEFDKIATLFVMTMRGYPAAKYQRASLSINYFDLISDPVFEAFAELMQDRMKNELTAIEGDGGRLTLVPNELRALLPEGVSTQKVSLPASSSLGVKSFAMIFAADNFNSTSNQTFGDYIDFRVAGLDDMSLPSDREVVRFPSVNGLKTYVVPQTRDNRSISFEIAKNAPEIAEKTATLLAELDELEVSLSEIREEIVAQYDDIESGFVSIYRMLTGEAVPASALAGFRDDKVAGAGRMLSLISGWKDTLTQQLAQAEALGNEAALAQLTETLTELEQLSSEFVSDAVAQFGEVSAAVETKSRERDNAERELTSIEAQLIQIQRLYRALN